jgi:hypothetical protein
MTSLSRTKPPYPNVIDIKPVDPRKRYSPAHRPTTLNSTPDNPVITDPQSIKTVPESRDEIPDKQGRYGKDKGGRPRKEIDYKVLDQLCKIQCTGEEVAAILGMSYGVMDGNIRKDCGVGFREYREKKGAEGRRSLRRKQYQLAMHGDRTMLIWLGKQYLGQADKQELTGANGGPIGISRKIDFSDFTDQELALIESAGMKMLGPGNPPKE